MVYYCFGLESSAITEWGGGEVRGEKGNRKREWRNSGNGEKNIWRRSGLVSGGEKNKN